MKKSKRNICKSNKSKKQKFKSRNKLKEIKKSEVEVKVNLKMGRIETYNPNYGKCSIKFRGFSKSGNFLKLYNRNEIQALQKEILIKYQERNGRIPPKKIKAITDLINKNVNTSIYKALEDYDINNFRETSASTEYINIMLKNIERKKYETDKDYKQRVIQERSKLLKRAGINIEYDLTGMFFNKNNLLDNIKILSDAIKMRKNSTVKIFNNKSKKHTLTATNEKNVEFEPIISEQTATKNNVKENIKEKYIDFENIDLNQNKYIEFTNKNTYNDVKDTGINFEPIQDKEWKFKTKQTSKKRYTSSKTLIRDLREKASNPDYIKRLKVAALLAISVVSFSSNTLNMANADAKAETNLNVMNLNQKTESNVEIAYANDNLNDILNQNPIISEKVDLIINNQNVLEDMTEQEIEEEMPIEIIDEVQEDIEENIIIENIDNIEINMNDALIEALDLGIDSECKISEGRYYSSADQTGKYGNYKNVDSSLKINYIVAIEEDGTYIKYDATSGKTSIDEIKKEHPNAEISYHMVTTGGKILGWNDSGENNIETQLVKNALMKIKGYLSPETMKFLCDNDLSSNINKGDCLEHLEAVKSAMQEYEKNIQKSHEDIER